MYEMLYNKLIISIFFYERGDLPDVLYLHEHGPYGNKRI